jgi:hypothetical protein
MPKNSTTAAPSRATGAGGAGGGVGTWACTVADPDPDAEAVAVTGAVAFTETLMPVRTGTLTVQAARARRESASDVGARRNMFLVPEAIW